MTLAEVHVFLVGQTWAVEATCSSAGAPQAAVIGVAITSRLELVFDTLQSSRKHANLLQKSPIALVIGWDAAKTVQIEGSADRPADTDLARIRDCYLAKFPDGRERAAMSEIAYWCVRPRWIRYSDFNVDPPLIVEWDRDDIAAYADFT